MATSLSQTTAPAERLSQMAAQLSQHELDAYYLPPEDEHLNEYLPANKQRISWLTGFTGESAPLLVMAKTMALFVDGRFHLQVDAEIDPTVIQGHKLLPDSAVSEVILMALKETLPGKPSYAIGYDPFITTPSRLKGLKTAAETLKLAITWTPVTGNLVDAVWCNRPDAVSSPAFLLADVMAGQSAGAKIKLIRSKLSDGAILPITKLDQIGWLFNLRGRDIPYNPVLEAYALLTPEAACLFAPLHKVPADVQTALSAQGVQLMPYSAYTETIVQMATPNGKPTKALIDNQYIALGTVQLLESAGANVVEGINPIAVEKDIKNATEIERMQAANTKASRAITRHLAYVESAFAAGDALTEESLRADIEAKYREEDTFFDLSFPTIPGIAGNSAIIHYSHADPNQYAKAGAWYLLDSGCHYMGGTTDTTRTTVFGTPSAEQIEKYTLVLKAHIACANIKFPEGTTGMQIDAVCRAPLWQAGIDFAHGTGHGVGPFMDVHAGRHRISKVGTVPFQRGMVTSIEPGYYEKDWGGIRLENLYVVVSDKATYLGKSYLRFQSLTCAPFEKKLIDFSKLTPDEAAWLKQYNQTAWETLSPSLNEAETAWLKSQCV